MGIAAEPDNVKLFVAVTFASENAAGAAVHRLTELYGPVELSYGPVPFNFTEYYAEEMGQGLQKTYMAFERPILRGVLAEVKTFTNKMELELGTPGKRMVNIDPGYLATDKFVLSSTKDFYHRIYLSEGIYAEVTLHYRKGMYRFFSWTFPDYREPAFLEFLEKVRARYVKTVRDGRASGARPD